MWSERPDFGSEMPNFGFQRPDLGLKAGLILERAREPDALYFALGLSCFASSEPGWLSVIDGMESKCSCWLSKINEKSSSFQSFFVFSTI